MHTFARKLIQGNAGQSLKITVTSECKAVTDAGGETSQETERGFLKAGEQQDITKDGCGIFLN